MALYRFDRFGSAVPSTLLSIGDGAFLHSHEIYEIDLPDALQSIGDFALYSANLSAVHIPRELREIGPFSLCGDGVMYVGYHLATITVDPENAYFCAEDNSDAVVEEVEIHGMVGAIVTMQEENCVYLIWSDGTYLYTVSDHTETTPDLVIRTAAFYESIGMGDALGGGTAYTAEPWDKTAVDRAIAYLDAAGEPLTNRLPQAVYDMINEEFSAFCAGQGSTDDCAERSSPASVSGLPSRSSNRKDTLR